ncbi:MAG: ABC transporter ATP-binding protein [Leptolyngbya sp. SIO4C1]|nr:ABC transporter ATP-binding protein [Leptolyngbya sp. SIO4C1]
MIDILKNTPRLVRLVWNAAPVWLLLNIGLMLLNSLGPIVQLYVGKLIVDQVVALVEAGTLVLPRSLIWLVAAGFALRALGALLQQASTYVGRVLEDQFLLYANLRLLKQATRLDLAYYESSQFYDVLNRAQQSGSRYPLLVVRLFTSLLGQLTQFGGLLTLLLRFSPWVTLLLLVSTLPTFWIGVHYSQRRYRMTRWQTPARRQADYFGEVLTEPQYVKEVRLFNLGHYLVDQYRRIRETFNQESRQLAARQSMAQFSLELISATGFYSAYALVIWQGVRGLVTIGDLTLYVGAFQQAQGAVEGILSSIASLYEYNLYVSQYFEFLDLEPQVVSQPHPKPFPTPIRRGLMLDRVNFTYPGASEPTLKEISLQVQPQECIALVGLNGSGKTTLLKLLTRLYDIDCGEISIDGVSLQQFALSDLRRNIGVLFQDFARYALNVEDNIGFGNLAKRDDRRRIQRSAADAGAIEVIEELSDGYETILGKMFAGGVDLSGGQWQKIGLARAFMSEAQILILDEPTAAVDAIAEHDLFQRFRQLTQGKMTFLVSHRFSTVRMADRIVVLEKGRIAEIGTHDELMAQQQRYAQMFQLQAASYIDDPE